jgi:elongation factor G
MATAKSRWSRCRAGGHFEFVNDIFGGAIPKNFIPAVEKGIRDAAARGISGGVSGGGLSRDVV